MVLGGAQYFRVNNAIVKMYDCTFIVIFFLADHNIASPYLLGWNAEQYESLMHGSPAPVKFHGLCEAGCIKAYEKRRNWRCAFDFYVSGPRTCLLAVCSCVFKVTPTICTASKWTRACISSWRSSRSDSQRGTVWTYALPCLLCPQLKYQKFVPETS